MVLDRYRKAADWFLVPVASRLLHVNPNLVSWGALFAAAFLVGLLSDDLLAGILQTFLALPIGAAVASLLSLSPVFAGLIVTRPDDVIFFTFRLGFPLFFLSIPILLFGTVFGIVLQERFQVGRY